MVVASNVGVGTAGVDAWTAHTVFGQEWAD